MQESFGDMELKARIKRDSTLMKVHALIDWEALRPLLVGLYKRESSRAGGQEPFDALQMFKATLLGQWHSLSDPKLEQALMVRIDFMHFCGLKLTDEAPDESTLCRFRNRLINAGKLTPLLAAVNAQLQGHGLMVSKATGAVIDATIIAAAARPRSQTIIDEPGNHPEGSQQDSDAQPTISQSQSVDPDATWVKKGSKSFFGYRTYVAVDEADGYVRGVHTAPANQSETTHFEAVLASADFKPRRVYADKGFASRANRGHLHQQAIKSAIMHKAQKGKPLTQRQHNANKRMSRVRYIVEQTIGTCKRLFGMARASYMGTVKVNAQFTLKAIGMNLLKAANKISLLPVAIGVVRLQ